MALRKSSSSVPQEEKSQPAPEPWMAIFILTAATAALLSSA